MEDSAYVHNEGRGWSRYPENLSQKIVEAYADGETYFQIKLVGHQQKLHEFAINFKSMQQINLYTDERMPIKIGHFDHEEFTADHYARVCYA